jgi:hypothetical protein
MWAFGMAYFDEVLRAIADFRAIACQARQKLIYETAFGFATSPTIDLIQCGAIALSFRPSVGSNSHIDKLWHVRFWVDWYHQ